MVGTLFLVLRESQPEQAALEDRDLHVPIAEGKIDAGEGGGDLCEDHEYGHGLADRESDNTMLERRRSLLGIGHRSTPGRLREVVRGIIKSYGLRRTPVCDSILWSLSERACWA